MITFNPLYTPETILFGMNIPQYVFFVGTVLSICLGKSNCTVVAVVERAVPEAYEVEDVREYF